MPVNDNEIITPLQLYREIEAAKSIEVLKELGIKMLDTVGCIITVPVDAKSIVQMIAKVNYTISRRLIALLEINEGICLPDGATYLTLGSEGRGEQTLRTDQDSAIVYPDDFPAEKLIEVNRFATRLVDSLDAIGVPRCPGNVMASNPRWCHSVSEWKQLVEEWIIAPTPENILDFCLLQDLSPLHGDDGLCKELRDHIRSAVWLTPHFFPNLARHATRFPSPLTFFRRIRVERRGEQRGKVDVKRSGIFAVTLGSTLMALEAGFVGGNTWDKLSLLGELGMISAGDLKRIEAAFSFLVRLRVQSQLQEIAARTPPSNHVDPRCMPAKEREQFRTALKGIDCFLQIVRKRYLLDFIST